MLLALGISNSLFGVAIAVNSAAVMASFFYSEEVIEEPPPSSYEAAVAFVKGFVEERLFSFAFVEERFYFALVTFAFCIAVGGVVHVLSLRSEIKEKVSYFIVNYKFIVI